MFTHTVTPPPQAWTPEVEHPNCRSTLYFHTQLTEEPDFAEWNWPYACHREGHVFESRGSECDHCGLPWSIENPVITAAMRVNHARASGVLDPEAELMFRSTVRTTYGSPPVVPV